MLFAFTLRNEFDRLMEEAVGENYCTFFEGRNGLYYILVYLKRKFRCKRILVPSGICLAVKLASQAAQYQISYYRKKPTGVREGDVVLTTDSSMRIRSRCFTIQDNARNPLVPSKDYDFTLYSFGNGKPLSSGGGGVVVVNNPRLYDFLGIRKALRKPSAKMETCVYLKSLFWKLTVSSAVRSYGKRSRGISESYGRLFGIKVTNLNLSMCTISKRLATALL
jgi:hypothetical protein